MDTDFNKPRCECSQIGTLYTLFFHITFRFQIRKKNLLTSIYEKTAKVSCISNTIYPDSTSKRLNDDIIQNKILVKLRYYFHMKFSLLCIRV